MFDARVVIRLADGTTHEIRDFLIDKGRFALKFYHACVSVGVGTKYEAKQEISASDFGGRAIRAKVVVEKKRLFLYRNIIEDYAAASAEVVNIRSA